MYPPANLPRTIKFSVILNHLSFLVALTSFTRHAYRYNHGLEKGPPSWKMFAANATMFLITVGIALAWGPMERRANQRQQEVERRAASDICEKGGLLVLEGSEQPMEQKWEADSKQMTVAVDEKC